MGFRTKAFLLIVALPAACLLMLVYSATWTFGSYVRADVFERQLGLLGSAHLLLGRTDGSDFNIRAKEIAEQPGFETLVISDSAGKIRFAPNPEWLGKRISEILAPTLMDRLAGLSVEEGSFELPDINNNTAFISFFGLDLKTERLLMFLQRSKGAALRASILFYFKALAAILALVAVAAFGERFLFSRVLNGLAQVSRSIEFVGSGQLDGAIPRISGGEFREISKQLEKAQKTLKNLNDAKRKEGLDIGSTKAGDIVKSRSFPPATTRVQQTDLVAFSEIGKLDGRWWFHFRTGSQLVFLIATTNASGLDQAVLLNGMWAAMNHIKDSYQDPAKTLDALNKLLFEIGVSQALVKAFAGAINTDNGELNWSCAGFPFPTVAGLRQLTPEDWAQETPPDRIEMRQLMGDKGSPLGENARQDFALQTEQLKNGEYITASSEGGKLLREILPKALASPEAERFNAEGLGAALKALLPPNGESPGIPSLLVVKWRSV